jgi:hypothetical protein
MCVIDRAADSVPDSGEPGPLRRLLRKVSAGDLFDFRDTSTLLEAEVVDRLIKGGGLRNSAISGLLFVNGGRRGFSQYGV